MVAGDLAFVRLLEEVCERDLHAGTSQAAEKWKNILSVVCIFLGITGVGKLLGNED